MAEVQIESWAAGGRGIGRVDGRVWMVVGGVPGDRVEARATKVRERFVEAVSVRVLQGSGLRRPPPCPVQELCGGCPMMPVDESEQHKAKRRVVVDALQRIGRLPQTVPVDDVVHAAPFVGYRNKIELTFSGRRPRRLGYHRADLPRELVDVAACAIADPRLQPALDAARSFFLEGPGSAEPALDDRGGRMRLVLRASSTRDERLIALRGPRGPFDSAAAFAEVATAADPGLVGVVRLIAGPLRRGGASVETIAGRSWITEELHALTFRVPAGTFLQVHPRAAERLGAFVLERAGSPREIIELYGGVGALGLAVARRGARATIVDADPDAIACGVEAAKRQGLETARFERADVLAFLSERGHAPVPDLVIADPPRTGLGRGVAERLAAIGAPRIVLISCDPATLARDLAELTARGYAADRVTPFDLFPQTAHIETVTWLTRTSGSAPR